MKPNPRSNAKTSMPPHRCKKYLHLSLQCQVQTVRPTCRRDLWTFTPSPTVNSSGADQVAHRDNRAVLRTVECRKECKRGPMRCRDSIYLLLVPAASASGEAETVAHQHHPR